jgi:hypothetical protein
MSGATSPEADTIIRQADTINRLMGQSANQIDKVQRSLDGAYAAQQKFAQAQNAINLAAERGRITQERANQLLDLARQKYQQTGVAAQAFAQANDNLSRGTRNFGSVIGQAGFQVQDFAVQVQGGTSALTAFAQQAPQFLGAFGSGGAIAGAVVAVGALAAGLLLGSQNAQAFRVSEEGLTEAYRASRAAIDDVKVATRGLIETRRQSAIEEGQIQLGRARLAQDRIEQERATIEGENRLARRAGTAADQGLILQNQQRVDELNRRAERAGQIADRLQQDLDRLTNLRRMEGLRDPRADENGPGNFEAQVDAARQAAERAQREAEAAERRAAAESRRRAAAGRAEVRLDDRARRERDQLIASLDQEAAANIRLEESLRRIDEARRRNQLSEQEAAQLSQQVRDRREQEIVRANDKSELYAEETKRLAQLSSELGDIMGGAFQDLVREGKSFEDTLRNIEQRLLRLGDKYLLEPLFQNLSQLALGSLGAGGDGKGGGGGMLGGLGGLLGILVGNGSGVENVATGALMKGAEGFLSAGVAHAGGIIGDPYMPTRPVPAEVFLDVPRYHRGGIAGSMPFASDEVPAVLRRGEMVLTERQQTAVANRGSPAPLTINIRSDDPGAFNRSKTQIAQEMGRAQRRAMARKA